MIRLPCPVSDDAVRAARSTEGVRDRQGDAHEVACVRVDERGHVVTSVLVHLFGDCSHRQPRLRERVVPAADREDWPVDCPDGNDAGNRPAVQRLAVVRPGGLARMRISAPHEPASDVIDRTVNELRKHRGKQQREFAAARDAERDDPTRVNLWLSGEPVQRALEVLQSDANECMWQTGFAEVREIKDGIALRDESGCQAPRRQTALRTAKKNQGGVIADTARSFPERIETGPLRALESTDRRRRRRGPCRKPTTMPATSSPKHYDDGDRRDDSKPSPREAQPRTSVTVSKPCTFHLPECCPPTRDSPPPTTSYLAEPLE